MRQFFILVSSLMAFCLIGVSCQKTSTGSDDGEKYVVSLNMAGEFSVDVDQDPLTKAASSNDVYGINVYYDKEGDGTANDIYAYGLFDNVADMTITLLSNHKYKVCCTLVKDAKNTLFFGQAFSNTYSGYAYPFQTTASGSTLVNNRFIIGTSTYLSGIGSGKTHTFGTTDPSSSNAIDYSHTNRFYGETNNYVPVPNGTIDIYLKRTVFGAKFVVSGVSQGTLAVKAGSFFSSSYTKNSEGTETLYVFPDVRGIWSNDLPLVATVSMTYTSNRGPLWNLSKSQSIQFKRNVMTTVNIQLSPDLSGAKFNIVEEEMDDENVIDLGINTDGLIDIIVNPEG